MALTPMMRHRQAKMAISEGLKGIEKVNDNKNDKKTFQKKFKCF